MTIKFIILLLLSAIMGSIAFLFPHITGDDLGLKIIGGLAFATTIAQALAIWFFLTSLHAFKKQLQQAYLILAGSIVLLGVAQVLLLVSFFFVLPDSLRSWLFVISYVLSAATGYWAMRKFAGLLEVSSWLRSPLLVGLISAIVGVAILFWPHEDWGALTLETNILFGCIMFSGTVALLTAFLAVRIKKALGGQYTNAAVWLILAFLGLAIANYMEAITKITGFLTTSWYYALGLNISPQYITALLFLGAGLALKKLSHENTALPENSSYVDVVNYAANLVSHPAAIDKSLDKMRQITALQSSSSLTAENKATLVKVYLDIEKYLVTKEPLRAIDKEQLRQKLPSAFKQELPL